MNQKFRREDILEKATELFACKGYTALGINEILVATGMSKGAFYNAFKSKEQLFIEVLDFYATHGLNRIARKLKTDQRKAIKRIEDFYSEMIDMQLAVNNQGCLINSAMAEMGSINTSITQATCKHYNDIIRGLKPTVVEAQKQGDLNASIDSERLAELIHSSFYGILNRQKGLAETDSGKELIRILLTSLN